MPGPPTRANLDYCRMPVIVLLHYKSIRVIYAAAMDVAATSVQNPHLFLTPSRDSSTMVIDNPAAALLARLTDAAVSSRKKISAIRPAPTIRKRIALTFDTALRFIHRSGWIRPGTQRQLTLITWQATTSRQRLALADTKKTTYSQFVLPLPAKIFPPNL